MGDKGAIRRTGERNPNWRGGRTTTEHGYVLLRLPAHPRADSRGYIYEHIVVAEAKIGRALLPGEEVHHSDLNRSNNRPDNLTVKASHADHGVEHRKRLDLRKPGESNPRVACACGCGATFPRYDDAGRPRRFLPGHNSGLLPAPAPCACGCGELASSGKRFVRFHRPRRERPLVACACGCGRMFPNQDAHGRGRRYVSGHNAKMGA